MAHSPLSSKPSSFDSRLARCSEATEGLRFPILRSTQSTRLSPALANAWIGLLLMCAMGGRSAVEAQQPLAQRPTAPRLFSSETLAYVRIDDTRELKAKLAETSTGKLATDPQLSPILKEFYSSLNQGIEGLQKEFGLDLNEMLSIPNGEFAIAIVPGPRNPIPVLLVEAGAEMPALELIVARAEERIQSRGGGSDTKKIGPIETIQWRDPNREDRQFGYFIDSGVLVFAMHADHIESLAKIWTGNGIDHVPLSENRRFTSILTQCVGAEGERPQISFYVDPMKMVKEATKRNPMATASMVMLPALGIDGIQAVGGSIILAPNGFDSIVHAHLLLASPRRGLLEVLRPKSGATDPQNWVPSDVESYMTANWDIGKTFKAVKELYETFRGPDTFYDQVLRPAEKGLGIDVEKEFFNEIADRLTMSQLMLRPARINGESRVFAIELKNPQAFASTTLPKIFENLKRADPQWKTESFGSQTIYTRPSKKQDNSVRRSEPAITVIDKELLIGDSLDIIKAAIETSQSADGLLNQSLEYKLVRDHMKRQLDERETSMVTYQQPEESMRQIYDLAADPNNIQRLRDMSKQNPLFAAIVKALEAHQLPPFEAIAKHLSPSGAFVTEEENGLHYTAFSLQRASRD